jgi:hypothetical protein
MQNSLHIKTISLHNFAEKTFFALVSLLALSVALYLYFISATILSVVDRSAALNETKILGTKISELESEYMAFGAAIDLSGAKTLGYEEVAKIDYVSRTASLGFATR